MTNDYVDTAVIDQIAEALDHSRTKLASVEIEYNRLKAQVVAYERTLQQLRALENGDFENIVSESSDTSPKVRHDSKALKDQIYEYFASRPRLVQSPRGLTSHLVEEHGWPEKGLRIRVSNLLRKIDREEAWLEKRGHGKYQFVSL